MKRYIVPILFFSLFLAGCGVSRKVQLATGDWKNTRSKAQVEAAFNGQSYSAVINMTGIRDTLMVFSYAPFLGIEAARIEATPSTLRAFVKLNKVCYETTYPEISQILAQQITWQTMEELASGKNSIRFLKVNYLSVEKDVPQLKVRPINPAGYKQISNIAELF